MKGKDFIAGSYQKSQYFIVRIKKLSWKSWLMAAVAAIIAAGILVLVFWPEQPEEYIPTVTTMPVTTQDVEIYGEYPGSIRAQQFVEVRARVEGYLEKMLFEEGTYVKKDQVLFIIDPRQYQAKVDKAKALLKKNKALAMKAERDLSRIRPLYEQKAASQLDLDNAIASYESATADVMMSEADLMQDELTLSYTTVRSPISGYISERHVDIGTLVGPGGQSLLANIVKSDTVLVEFKMTDLDYQMSKSRNVNFGQKDSTRNWDPYITITLADKTVYKYKGLVDFADPQVDSKSGTFSVRAAMPNPSHALLPGQFTNVKLLLDVRENAVVVPTKAIEIERSGAFIYVLRSDDIVEKRFIETGPEIGNNTVVERGLFRGERIVVEGYHKLTHGMKARSI
ncbi:MAG: efflux RND transporter periplasmic adaptor subunit [Bacteroidales bacterium]|nr:efflux RND transporter periplasmic adaptor subunit [Bacteroidales bacterium]